MARKEIRPAISAWQKDIPNDRMAHLIRDTGRLLAKSLQQRLVEHNVSFGHWSFLRILWAREGLTQAELSELAGVMAPTTFTALKAMEAKGLIKRRREGGNQRKMFVYLTEKGRGLKDVLTPLAEDVNRVAMENISRDDQTVMRRILLTMIENLQKDNYGVNSTKGNSNGKRDVTQSPGRKTRE